MLREADRTSVAAVAKKHGVSAEAMYAWLRKFGGMDVSEAKRLKQLEVENRRLKKIVAERDLEIEVMKEIAAKKGERGATQNAGGVREKARAFVSPRLRGATRRAWKSLRGS